MQEPPPDAVTRIRAARHVMKSHSILLGGFATLSVVMAIAYHAALRGEAPADAPFRRFGDAIMIQFLIWGLIDLGFALAGLRGLWPTHETLDEARVHSRLDETRKALKFVRFNHHLNHLWVASGLVLLIVGLVTRSAVLLGHGAGVLIQGGFLLVIDRRLDGRLARCVDTQRERDAGQA